MAKDKGGPGDPRSWVGDEARRILGEADALLKASQAVLEKARGVTESVDQAARASATTLASGGGASVAVSPLAGRVAVTVEAGGQPAQAVLATAVATPEERRGAELSPLATSFRIRAAQLTAQAKGTTSRLRFAFKGKENKSQGIEALKTLEVLLARAATDGLSEAFTGYAHGQARGLLSLTSDQEAAAVVRIAATLGLRPPSADPRSVRGQDLAIAKRLAGEAKIALGQRPALVELVKRTFGGVQDRMVDRQLHEIPVERLKEAAGGRIRFKTLGEASIVTVYDALHPRYPLSAIHGISDTMAQQVTAAARQVAKAVRDDLRFRIDLDKTDQLVTDLLTALHSLLGFDAFFDGNADALQQAADYLSPLLSLPGSTTGLSLLGSTDDSSTHLGQIKAWADWATNGKILEALTRAAQPKATRAAASDVWSDFERRSPAYYALLGQIVDLKLDIEAAEGFLPQDIVDRVHEQELDETFLRVSLRGYQSFGARYALVQRKVILGDEMGLGKTVQAIAVMAHLEATGHTHYLVVCPASVLINWTREVRLHSTLKAHHVHGSDRDRTWKTWQKYGGVAVTTFDTLRALDHPAVAIALLTVDEAHYIKNPATIRAQYVTEYVDTAERTLFMTGTPMENRVEEFRQLIHYLQPVVSRRVSATDGIAGARRFRETVAPVYLRRNTEDVLQELPPMVQVDEWEEFERAEWLAYRDAVASGNFMAMRRVAFLADSAHSTKLVRLVELADEAGANGHKVIVFSYFREVLEVVAAALGKRAVGPLTGSIAAARRQQLVDEFTKGPSTAVMVSQIQAGGVGLNMQAGSVVILCEPQVKPSLEAQAIARAHRMGQVRTVQVHRLLIADSVDQRMIEILDSKQKLFDEYARGSDIADASPEAIDVSEKALARQVVEQEQERLALRLTQELSIQEAAQD